MQRTSRRPSKADCPDAPPAKAARRPVMVDGTWPLGLSSVQSAVYVGVGITLFNIMVADRRMPKPKRIGRRRVWDRRLLDAAFDELPSDDPCDDDVWDDVSL